MNTPGIGRKWPPELTVGADPVSGATVRQLTSYRAHSNHSYFTRYTSTPAFTPTGPRFFTRPTRRGTARSSSWTCPISMLCPTAVR